MFSRESELVISLNMEGGEKFAKISHYLIRIQADFNSSRYGNRNKYFSNGKSFNVPESHKKCFLLHKFYLMMVVCSETTARHPKI